MVTRGERTPAGIRGCGRADADEIAAVVNAAAEVYRGVIPADRWHEPYMSARDLASELADGVVFSGCVAEGGLVGVMGFQRRSNVGLVRHAYVRPAWQGRGVGSRLLGHLCRGCDVPILVGTWAAADWAVRFYRRHGFAPVGEGAARVLLETYWNVPERQVATSVVLALPALSDAAAERLAAGAVRPADTRASEG